MCTPAVSTAVGTPFHNIRQPSKAPFTAVSSLSGPFPLLSVFDLKAMSPVLSGPIGAADNTRAALHFRFDVHVYPVAATFIKHDL